MAEYCVNKTEEVIGKDNITDYIESSAGNGIFLNYLHKPYLAYDIEPDDIKIQKQDFLTLDLPYKQGRCVIGNPPYGRCLNMAQKFFKKSIKIADYISFILPISQLNNTQSFFEFDLLHSEDLGVHIYTDRELHCCLNIYHRPKNGLHNKKQTKLKDITIYRQDSKGYDSKPYDIRICYWGDGTAGKILKDGEHYSAEYKIKINNEALKDKIVNVLSNFNWKKYLNCIAMRKIQQFHIVDVLQKKIPEIK